MRTKKWSEEDFINAVKESKSIRQVIMKLGLVPAGGNYNTVHKGIQRLNLDTSHFTGMLWSKGQKLGEQKPIWYYLKLDGPNIGSHALKKRLLVNEMLEYKCDICEIDSWNGKELKLQLDHTDGNKRNNTLENLRLLCPNCHSQTDTYCGKNGHIATYV